MDEHEILRYNTTPLCGLDNMLPNSYCNSLLQVNLTRLYEKVIVLMFAISNFCFS